MMTVAYALIAFIPAISSIALPFLLVYGVSYFFAEFGPNVTTFVYPAEVFPVMIRTTGHGIAAALGKVGAFIGALLFPLLLSSFHLPGAMTFAACVSLVGLVVTFFLLPEPKQRSLEDISNEYQVTAEPQAELVAER
jgi:MFS family permease